ncbi:hypothetical protein [Bacterioplanes sanyensis]|uniref:hypothetical protein n=1 Tax=Bacterioplanes sanyensis TaxID=1249553 RepID=UPI0018EEB150|nr:hypothetical protein [Bacterioplanes sanyensis]
MVRISPALGYLTIKRLVNSACAFALITAMASSEPANAERFTSNFFELILRLPSYCRFLAWPSECQYPIKVSINIQIAIARKVKSSDKLIIFIILFGFYMTRKRKEALFDSQKIARLFKPKKATNQTKTKLDKALIKNKKKQHKEATTSQPICDKQN